MPPITQLGKYQIRRELGKGAMGIVYEGFDPGIERVVAIKTILPSQLKGGEVNEVLARFKREAQAAGRLNHPGIVAVYDYGEVVAESDHTMVAGAQPPLGGGQRVAFIAMEYVKGRELREFFEADERFPLKHVERLMVEMLDALDHAHGKGVTHRDMKPANLIVLADGRIKVADFGIARLETSELTQAGTILGTPAYMSPEQFMGQTVDGRSDLFSCGVILYQFLTGEKPFTGNATTIMYKVLREEPLPPSTLNLSLPAAWDAVVKKAIAKVPADRFQSAKEFADAIRAAAVRRGDDPTFVGSYSGLNNPDVTALKPTGPHASYIPPIQVQSPLGTGSPTPASVSASSRAVDPIMFSTMGGNAMSTGEKSVVKVPPAAFSPQVAPAGKSTSNGALVGGIAGVLLVGAAGAFWMTGKNSADGPAVAQNGAATVASVANTPAQPAVVSAAPTVAAPAPAAVTPRVSASAEPAQEPGTLIISALGLVDPKDPKFNGDANAAQSEARADASRQLVEKALALYVDKSSLNKNYAVLEQKLLSQSGSFIKTVLHEGAATSGKDGLIETETRAVIKMRAVQKSLNQLSKEERVDFIRNNGDPKVSINMSIANADTAQIFPSARSVLAENVLKERIKSFGFRVWSSDAQELTGPKAQVADFAIQGEAKLKQLSMKLQASGLTVTKTVLTSWTIKAVDKNTGEEIYLNTVMPKGQSWTSEDQALADIGKMVGDEFSKGFFLQHFTFGTRKTNLKIAGLPDKQTTELVLRELRGIRQVLDVQWLADSGQFQLQLADGSASDIIEEAIFKPLNTKLGQTCFSLAGSNGSDVNATFASACAAGAARGKLETVPPAGLLNAADSRGKSLLKGLKTT
jgi:eukaryotic-like serine/threonine-protein kinase